MTEFRKVEIEGLGENATLTSIVRCGHPIITHSHCSIAALVKDIAPVKGVIADNWDWVFGYSGKKENLEFLITEYKVSSKWLESEKIIQEYFKDHRALDNSDRVTIKKLLKEITDIPWIHCHQSDTHLIFTVAAGEQPVFIAAGFKD